MESEDLTIPRKKMWFKSGQHGNAWLRAEVGNITSTTSWRFVFESFRGNGFSGDITLDGLSPSLGCETGSEFCHLLVSFSVPVS